MSIEKRSSEPIRLLDALRKKAVRDSLQKLREDFVESLQEYDSELDDDPEKAKGELRANFLRWFNPMSACDLFQDLVLSKIERPPMITAEELSRDFAHHVVFHFDVPFDIAYEHFCVAVESDVRLFLESEPIPTLLYNPTKGYFDLSSLVAKDLLPNAAIQIQISGQLPAGSAHYEAKLNDSLAYATLGGRFTPEALKEAVAEFRDVVTTLLRNCYLLEERRFFRDLAISLNNDQSSRPHEEDPRYSTEASERHQPSFFAELAELFDSYYSLPTKKDSIRAESETLFTCKCRRISSPSMLLAWRCP